MNATRRWFSIRRFPDEEGTEMHFAAPFCAPLLAAIRRFPDEEGTEILMRL